MRYTHHLKIYKKRSYLLITFAIVVLPFLFILIFSPLTGVNTTQVFIDIGASFMRVAVAYVISLVLAIGIAVFLGQGRAGDFTLPLLDVLQSFPSFALLPLFTVWFGAGNTSAIFFLIITIVWPILFSTVSAIKMARNDLQEAAHIFGARGIKKLLAFTVPVALPGLVTGSIVGVGEGWEAIVGAEIIGVTPGIGGFLNNASSQGNLLVLAYGIVALMLFLFSLNKIIWLPLLKRSHDYSHE